jgi:hypothetical protein
LSEQSAEMRARKEEQQKLDLMYLAETKKI